MVLLAGAVAAWLLLGGTSREETVPAPEGRTAAGDDPPPREPDLETRVERVPEGRTAPARLTVRVVDEEGGALEEARIVASAGKRTWEGRGRETFVDLLPGATTLRVDHEGYPTWERTLELDGGEHRRQIVQLRHDIVLRGRVLDRFGAPQPGLPVWLLRPGQAHPTSAAVARSLISAMADPHGRVHVTVPEAGRWRVTVGRVSKPEVEGEARELRHGGPDHFEGVVPGATRLEVRIRYPGEPEPLTAVVLQRREEQQRSAGERREEGDLLGEWLGRGRGTELIDEEEEEAGDGTAPERVDVPEWIDRQSRRVPNDGNVVFPHLPAGRELRLAVVRGGERYESASSQTLLPDQRVVAHVDVPAPGTASEEGPPLPLPIRWTREPLPPDERPAGIHWEVR